MKTDILSLRLPPHIIEYFRKNGYNPRTLLEKIYSEKRKNEIPELKKEIEDHQKRIVQCQVLIEQKTKEEQDRITKQAKCNTPQNETPISSINRKAIEKERERRKKEGN